MILRRASNGATVGLGLTLGRGGEGVVHAIHGAPKLVAKIYLKPPDASKVEKLKLMIRGGSPGILRVAAWPTDLLLDERGAVRGFLMPRIAARQDAHRLYSPKSRRRTFPGADFRFVVRAATNVARAFAQVHAAGHVIGDVNHGNALIGKDGTSVLIDCDSIQVSDQRRTFACDVGTPLFTPPELQGKAFRGLVRAANHDSFGLAVLLFHLLFQGRHPFAGRFADGEMPIERAIAESRFAYGANSAVIGMFAPPATLPLGTFGPRIAALFERAFAPPGGERPRAIEWIEPLEQLERDLAACRIRPRHFHPRGDRCCWCDIEKTTGARLFDDGHTSVDADAVTAEELWRVIEGLQPPPLRAAIPKFAAKFQDSLDIKDLQGKLGIGFAGAGMPILIGAGLAAVLSRLPLGISEGTWFMGVVLTGAMLAGVVVSWNRYARTRRALRAQWRRAIGQWRSLTSASTYYQVRVQLENKHRSLVNLREQRLLELDKVGKRFEAQQRAAFLDTFEIERTVFQTVSRSQVEALLNRGIRSAGDVLRRDNTLHKFVQSTSLRELRSWANQCDAQFKFDTTEPAYSVEAGKIEERFRVRRQSILDDLRQGPEKLAAVRKAIDDARAQAEDQLRRTHEKMRRPRLAQKQ